MIFSVPPANSVNGPIRVVLVDDTDDIRTLLRLQLAMEPGIEVVGEAADGEDAPTVVGATQPDVLIMDVMMPKVDGIAALPAVAAASPGTKVIIYSSRVADDTQAAALAAGAAMYMEKPAAPHPSHRRRSTPGLTVWATGTAFRTQSR